ncbi:MAG TPA: GldG family protein [Polyangiaceae bacterium]
MERKQKARTESLVLLVVLALICVAVNALGAFGMYARKDMTKVERYTLSNGSAHLLRSMKQKMTVDAYVTKGLPKLDAYVRDLRDLLEEYKNAGGGKFDYNLIEVKDDEKKKEEAEKEGLKPLQIQESDESDKAGIAQGYMGLVFKYGVEKDTIPVLSPDNNVGLEFWITNKIRELRDRGDGVKHKVGVLTGDDEMKLSEANLVPAQMGKPSMQDVISRNFPFYTFVDVDLKGGDAAIDDTLDGLIITQPGKDLTDKELRRIDEFVMKGKSLAVFASAVNLKEHDATMNATLSTHNLDKLLDGYGIEMHKDVVLDFGRSFRVTMVTQAGLGSVRFPQLLEVMDDSRFTGDSQLMDTAFPPFFRMEQVILPFCSSLTLHKDKQPSATDFGVVARSTPHSIDKTDDTVELGLQSWRPKGEWKQFNVAAHVEGRLKSAFPAGDKQGVDAAPEVPDGKSARIFVLASSQFTANPFARAGNGQSMQQFGGMPMGGDEKLLQIAGPYADLQRGASPLLYAIMATKNTLDWLTGDTDLLAVSAKLLSEPGLVYGDVSAPKFDENQTDDDLKRQDQEMREARKSTQRNIGIFLTFLTPLLFAAYGILRWRMRMNARMNVQLA